MNAQIERKVSGVPIMILVVCIMVIVIIPRGREVKREVDISKMREEKNFSYVAASDQEGNLYV